MKKTFPALKTCSNNTVCYIAFIPLLELKEIINTSKIIHKLNAFDMTIGIKVDPDANAEWIEFDLEHEGNVFNQNGLLVINNIENVNVSLPKNIFKILKTENEENMVNEKVPVIFTKNE